MVELGLLAEERGDLDEASAWYQKGADRVLAMAKHLDEMLELERRARRQWPGSSTQILSVGRLVIDRIKVCPRKVNAWPGRVWRAAASSAAAVLRRWSTVRTSTGSTGSRSRVRASMRAFPRLAALRWLTSSSPTGQGATHRPQRAGSSIAHWARSR
jgi:hypothetical protein